MYPRIIYPGTQRYHRREVARGQVRFVNLSVSPKPQNSSQTLKYMHMCMYMDVYGCVYIYTHIGVIIACGIFALHLNVTNSTLFRDALALVPQLSNPKVS